MIRRASAMAATTVAKNILEHGLSAGELVNVNVPALEPGASAEFEVTRLGKRVYQDELIGVLTAWREVGAPSSYFDSHSTIAGRLRIKPL